MVGHMFLVQTLNTKFGTFILLLCRAEIILSQIFKNFWGAFSFLLDSGAVKVRQKSGERHTANGHG